MNPMDLQRPMLNEGFRDRLIVYLENIIKLDFDWNDEPDEIEIHGKAQWEHPSYQFPDYDIDANGDVVDDDEWTMRFLHDAKGIAAMTETHKHTATCRKKGTICRFGFAGSGKVLVERTTIDLESGRIQMKRANTRANNHNPAIAAVTRSNHDIKMTFTSGFKSLQSLYYMTAYTSKFEDDTSDILAMDSAFKALESENLLSHSNAKERILRLIIRMNYIRQGSLQFSGAQVADMLLDIGCEGTHYTSATFCRINLYTFINHVQRMLGDFRVQLTTHDATIDEEEEVEDDGELIRTVMEDDDAEVEVDTPPTKLPRVIEDYIYRGDRLQSHSLYEVSRKTECVSVSSQEKEQYFRFINSEETRRGRPYNERVLFQPQHSCESSHWIRIRSKQVVPCILGAPPLLLQLGRKLTDTIRTYVSSQRRFGERRTACLPSAPPFQTLADTRGPKGGSSDLGSGIEEVSRCLWYILHLNLALMKVNEDEHERLQFMANVDTLSKSRRDVEEERLEREKEHEMHEHQVSRLPRQQPPNHEMEDDDGGLSHYAEDSRIPLERYLMYCNPRVKSVPTQKYVAGALSIGRLIQILPSFGQAYQCLNTVGFDNLSPNQSFTHFQLPNVVAEEWTRIWTDQIKADIQQKRDERARPSQISYPNIFTSNLLHTYNGIHDGQIPGTTIELQLKRIIAEVAREQMLNTAQLRCYSIFLNGLRSQARGEAVPSTANKCMYLGGSGGTGKSRVIQAIVTLFNRIGCPEKLVVSATTGIAANLIHGSTIHSVCHLSRGNQGDEETNRADRNRQLNLDNSWTNCEFLIIDEVSMLGCKGLNEISVNLCKLKACVEPFGGLYVLFSGDLHQLPCIGDKSLYIDIRNEKRNIGDSISLAQKAYMIGAELWEYVTSTTVLLTEHYRAPNGVVNEVLDRIR